MQKRRSLSVVFTVALLVISAMAIPVSAQPVISMSDYTVAIGVGEEVLLSYSISDSYNGDVYWSSSNTGVADVSSSGRVRGRGYGSATLTASLDNGSSASCEVRVDDRYNTSSSSGTYDYRHTRVKMHTKDQVVNVGNSFSLDFTVEQYYEKENGYTTSNYMGSYDYSSSDSSVAEVSSDGTVKAKKAGVATITVDLVNGDAHGSIQVVVKGRGDDGFYYDNGYFTSGPSYESSSSSSSSSASSKSTGTTSISSSKDKIKLTEKATRETVIDKAVAANGQYAVLKNYASVSAESLQAAAKQSTSPICFDTMSGSSIAGRLVFTPSAAGNFSGDLRTGVFTNTGNTQAVSNVFSKTFSNQTQVILVEQDTFAVPVEVVVKAPKLDDANLYFYLYNPETSQYSQMTTNAPANAAKDTNGFLHFTTKQGGYIVVSDGKLTK